MVEPEIVFGAAALIVMLIATVKFKTVRIVIAGALCVAALLSLHGALAEPVIEGNIDLDSRIVVVNGDNFSTEISFSVEIDGIEVLLPLIIDGEIVSEEKAIEHFLTTGEHLGMFSCIEEANAYAEALHLRQEIFYGAAE